MKKTFLAFSLLLTMGTSPIEAQTSPTEGVIDRTFIPQEQLMDESLRMLARFSSYMKNIYVDAGKNSAEMNMGYFRARSAGRNNEDGVRTNLDLSMVCAFLYKYARPAGVELPEGVEWGDIRRMAIRSLVWAVSTHRSMMLAPTTNGGYWGSVEHDADFAPGAYQWESSLWTESLALSYWMLSECSLLNHHEEEAALKVIEAEANHELTRTIPTGFKGDTKAEENGWETNVLAAAYALMPDNRNAEKWREKLIRFAMNCLTTRADMKSTRVVDGRPACEWIEGANLFDDFTLQNHDYFHTSYQNVVIQELSESILALRLMRSDAPLPEALKWGVRESFDAVLKPLALADGELAMPNGNDWSMFLYDQLPAYSAMACIYGDADALMLENLAFKYTRARQQTTHDGSWMLHSDIGPRRMGVTAHRLMTTYLYHLLFSSAKMRPSEWDDFCHRYKSTVLFPSQDIVRSLSDSRFTCFSNSSGLRSTTGMIASNSTDRNKIFIPYKSQGTGNFLGHYTVGGKSRAESLRPLVYSLRHDSYVASGQLSAASGALLQNFSIYSTPGNAVILLDCVTPQSEKVVVEREEGGVMALSFDPFTSLSRTLYHEGGQLQVDATHDVEFSSQWVNIDNEVGIVSPRMGNVMRLGERRLVNSIFTSVLTPAYSSTPFTLSADSLPKPRCFVYLTGVDASATKRVASSVAMVGGRDCGGVLVTDADGTDYAFLTRFTPSSELVLLSLPRRPYGWPVLQLSTIVDASSAHLCAILPTDSVCAHEVRFFLSDCTAPVEAIDNQGCLRLCASVPTSLTVTAFDRGRWVSRRITMHASEVVTLALRKGRLIVC